jgi:Icc-related predicted phosphoesterase
MPFVKKTDIARIRELLLSVRDITNQPEVESLTARALALVSRRAGGDAEAQPTSLARELPRASHRRPEGTRIFFASDVHGSESCFHKFLNAAKFYDADVLILAGDLTGKGIVPFVEMRDGSYDVVFLGKRHRIRSRKNLADLRRVVQDAGFYPFFATPSELAEFKEDESKRDRLFVRLMVDTLRRWIALADSRLDSTALECYMSPGNDDTFDIDPVLGESRVVQNPDGRRVLVADRFEMITVGYANPSPWNLPRDTSEDDLARRISDLASSATDLSTTIFNLHCPPLGSGLDMGPLVDPRPPKSFATKMPRVASVGSQPIGSIAVRKAIERYQPLVSLHGHVHESRGACKIGRTLCVNPGSVYPEGILLGVLLDINKDGAPRYQFTSG